MWQLVLGRSGLWLLLLGLSGPALRIAMDQGGPGTLPNATGTSRRCGVCAGLLDTALLLLGPFSLLRLLCPGDVGVPLRPLALGLLETSGCLSPLFWGCGDPAFRCGCNRPFRGAWRRVRRGRWGLGTRLNLLQGPERTCLGN